jgi:hypothetical protein
MSEEIAEPACGSDGSSEREHKRVHCPLNYELRGVQIVANGRQRDPEHDLVEKEDRQ